MVAKDHTCIHEHACLYAQQIRIKGYMLSWPSLMGTLYAKNMRVKMTWTLIQTHLIVTLCIHENGSDTTHETSVK